MIIFGSVFCRKAGRAMWLFAAAFLTGCTHLDVDDCTEPGGKVLGEDVPRIRSSHVRMKLDDGRAAAARFAPFAAMAALAYEEASTCASGGKALQPQDVSLLRAVLAGSGTDSWQVVKAISPPGFCQDDIGFSYHVWTRKHDGQVDVVIAFRGTDNDNADDWVYGNLYWLTHWFTGTNQYERAEARTRQVIDYFRTGAGRPADYSKVYFYSIGHSLGGGLAQHVLYALPEDIKQAYAFDPSPVTAHTDTDVRGRLVSACSCLPELGAEARIYRFYESYEVLTHLRFVHKLFFAPNRHVQEVRFGYKESTNAIKRHSMTKLALNVAADVKSEPSRPYAVPWYAGHGARNGRSCTAVFEDAQKQSCVVPATTDNPCPQ